MANSLTPRQAWKLSRSPWEPFNMLRDEFDSMVSRLLSGEESSWTTGALDATLDLSETESAFEVRMDIPGVNAKDIDIQVNGNLLAVQAERKEETEEKGKTFHRVERKSGVFQRSVMLPTEVKADQIEARYDRGVLTMKLPKVESRKPKRIQVIG
jgi:HSP20 family protein